MTVYVDDVRHNFGNMVMCHMWADDLDELLAMADAIRVDRKWIQGHPTLSHGKHKDASWVHFDISLAKKAEALKLGAHLTDKFGPLDFTAELLIATGTPSLVELGERQRERYAGFRARDLQRWLDDAK